MATLSLTQLSEGLAALSQRFESAEETRNGQLRVAEERVSKLEARTTELTTELSKQQGRLSETISQLQDKFKELERQQEALTVLASSRGGSASSSSGADVIDTRNIGKPPNFHGEHARWRDWSQPTAIAAPPCGCLSAQIAVY